QRGERPVHADTQRAGSQALSALAVRPAELDLRAAGKALDYRPDIADDARSEAVLKVDGDGHLTVSPELSELRHRLDDERGIIRCFVPAGKGAAEQNRKIGAHLLGKHRPFLRKNQHLRGSG